jgi:glycosyltransferase involved in cell wall biosynthesis
MMPSERPAPSLLVVATVATTIRQFISPHAAHMRALGWRVGAAAAGAAADPDLAARFDEVHELPLSRSIRDIASMVAGERAITRLLNETDWDVVHVHTPIASFVARLAVRRMPLDRRPAVAYTAHGFHFHRGGHPIASTAFLTAERVGGRWTDRLIVINDEDEAAARHYRLVPVTRLVRHPGIGLDTDRYSPSAVPASAIADVRRDLQITGATPLFVTIGELNRNKRHADAMVAIARLRDRQAHLAIVGEGSLRAGLAGLATDLGLDGRVHFAGQLADVRPILATATALVAPSRREGLSRSVMEALSLEIPVIASSARGNAELVGDSGFVNAVGDTDGMTTAMEALLSRPEEGRSMGARGRARMVAGYDVRLVGRLHEALYAALLVERASGLLT